MKLEDITAAIRPRSDWEAVDLGWALARRHYGSILKFWLLTAVPVWALILGLLHDRPLMAMVLIWWLKPVYERVPLFVLGRSLFGEEPGLRDLFRNWPRLMFLNLPRDLLIRRLSAHRSLVMPVSQLEGPRRATFYGRAHLLVQRSGGTAFSMQFASVLMLHSLWVGTAALIFFMIPPQYQPSLHLMDGDLLELIGNQPGICLWVGIGLYLVALTIMTPFCVGGGFGLYLNTRTEVEGWDVELAFRRLGMRLGNAGMVAAVLLALSLTVLSAQEAGHGDAAGELSSDEVIREVLGHKDFKIRTETRWRKKPGVKDDPQPGWLVLDWGWGGGAFAAQLLKIAIIATGGLLLVVLLVRAIQAGMNSVEAPARPKPKSVVGLNVQRESLPRDIASEARKLWEQGRFQDAIGLLYRGAISWMIDRENLPIQESDTEQECLQRSQEASSETVAAYFGQLTRAWVGVAYGQRIPTAPEAGQLFENWPFGGKGHNAG